MDSLLLYSLHKLLFNNAFQGFDQDFQKMRFNCFIRLIIEMDLIHGFEKLQVEKGVNDFVNPREMNLLKFINLLLVLW